MAAASTFSVQVSDWTREKILSIENMSSYDKVRSLKGEIIKKLGLDINKVSIVLSRLDNTIPQGFKVLEDTKTLREYDIDENTDYTDDNNVLRYTISLPVKTDLLISNTLLQQYLNQNLTDIPVDTTVVNDLTSDMKDSIIYILPKTDSKQGLKCRIVEVGPIIHTRSRDAYQKIQIEVIEKVILQFNAIGGQSLMYSVLKGNRVRIENVAAAAAQGGRRKRARKTKRVLCKRRRTHRKHRK
jgi:hypothetical protein